MFKKENYGCLKNPFKAHSRLSQLNPKLLKAKVINLSTNMHVPLVFPFFFNNYNNNTYDNGTITKNGPIIFFFSIKYDNKAIVWIVFPRPISSARIPFKLLLCKDTSHSKPLICVKKEKEKYVKIYTSLINSSDL